MKKQINVIGNYFGGDGYSSHTKQLVLALNKYFDICVVTNKPGNWEKIVNDEEYKMLSRNPEETDTAIFIGLPPAWKMYMYDYENFYGFCVWEGDTTPIGWLNILLNPKVKGIFVPSTHTKDAIKKVVLYEDEKIHIIPHGVNKDIFYPKEIEKDKFTFICNGGWVHGFNDRKGISYLIQAFVDEFTKDEDVRLLLKINTSYGCDVNKNMAEINFNHETAPKIDLVMDNLKYEDLVNFYNKGDIYVCTSLAEGFNLGILESMACGVPAISTTFGGMSDFVNEDNGWLLKEGEMKYVDYDLMYEEVQWKHPSIEEIRKKLREVFNLEKDKIKEKIDKALETTNSYTWDNSAKKVYEVING